LKSIPTFEVINHSVEDKTVLSFDLIPAGCFPELFPWKTGNWRG